MDQGPGASHCTGEKNKCENSVCLFWQHKHETICGHEVRTPPSTGLGSSGWAVRFFREDNIESGSAWDLGHVVRRIFRTAPGLMPFSL